MRDLVGYGQKKPDFCWPNGARIAINFVINFESGAEPCPLDGDAESEMYLSGLPAGAPRTSGERHLSSESLFEYGARCGVWRLHDLFDQYRMPVTVFACGRALARHEGYASYLKASKHEVAGHGYQWIDYRLVSYETEQQHIKKTLDVIEKMTGRRASGWYTGRRSEHTLSLLAEEDLLYLSDSYADDLPYWMTISQKQQLIIPYTLVTNDCRFATTPGFSCANDFFLEMKAAFDWCEYQLGKTHLLTIGLHDRLSGHPSRATAIQQFLAYISKRSHVWVATRAQIADFWRSKTKNVE